MKLFNKKLDRQVGHINLGLEHDKKAILEQFQKQTLTDESIQFRGELDGKPLTITLKRGSWCIMESMIPHILSYVPGDIIEIGMGESTQIFAKAAKEARVNLYSCDIQMGGMFKVFDEPLFENHQCFTDGSDSFMEQYGGSPAIVFIDGEHLYDTVKKEVEFFLPKIRPGGIMFLHDTMPIFKRSITPDSKGYNPGDIYRVRQELECDPRYDVFTWPYSAQNQGLTMVMAHDKHRPYWRENGRVK